MREIPSLLLAGLFLLACNPHRRELQVVELKSAPEFNTDSAFLFIEQQLENGPRIPGTAGHQACGDLINRKLKTYGFIVTEQQDTVEGHDEMKHALRNILGSLNPEKTKRLLLCAHWDSRPFADQDVHDPLEPIAGANDNASGVAILLEMARLMAIEAPEVGIDMVFFDLEDQGRPAFDEKYDPDNHGFCLGSKYWAERFNGQKPAYAILLDMVGAKDAVFTMEGFSMQFAPRTIEHVWNLGHQLGFGPFFKFNRTRHLYDDHVHVNEIAQIPCINITQQDTRTESGYGAFWHTHHDDLNIIDRKTLQAVGQTLVQTIYNE